MTAVLLPVTFQAGDTWQSVSTTPGRWVFFPGRQVHDKARPATTLQGNANDYESLPVDNYYALLAVLDRAGVMEKLP